MAGAVGDARSTAELQQRIWEMLENILYKLDAVNINGGTLTATVALPSDYPLPTAQVSALTPPAAFDGVVSGSVTVNNPFDGVVSGSVTVSNPTADPETGLATSAKQDELLAKFTRELTERMLNKLPALGYSLWFDTADAAHIYTLEAPTATAAGSTGFRGIRVSLVDGFPVGKVESNTAGTLTFSNRTSDGGWS